MARAAERAAGRRGASRMAAASRGEPPSLELMGVTKRYPQAGGGPVNVLRGVELAIEPGETVALVGPSGAGKSTLLHIAGLLDRPNEGAVMIGGRDVGKLGDGARTALRRTEVGFVYQFHHLLPEFSAMENVMMAQLIAGRQRTVATAISLEILQKLGLGERSKHRPNQLSGGEQQRVAIARAVANQPRILLADEPTGNLDPETSEMVFEELLELIRAEGLCALVATHNHELARRMDRIVEMRGGRLVER